MPCASWLHTVHRHGAITSFPQMVGAAMMHPALRAVMPWRPAPLVNQDGTAKHAGARHAAQRCMATLRQDHPHLRCIVTADRLRATAPPSETLPAHGLRSLLGVKDGEHAFVFAQGQAAEPAGHVPSYARPDRAAGVTHR